MNTEALHHTAVLAWLQIATTVAEQDTAAYKVGQIVGGILAVILMLGIPILFVFCLVKLVKTKKRAWLFGLIACSLPLLGFLALIAYGAYSGIKASTTRAKAIASTAIVSEETVDVRDSDLSVVLPVGWSVLKDLNPEAELGAGNLAKEEYFVMMTESKIDFAGDLAEYAEITGGNMIAELENSNATILENVTINGISGIQREISGTIDNVNIVYLHTALETPEYYHQAIGWTLKSRKGSAFPVIKKVTESITKR
ncbi:MAG: hypothetical protein AB8D78_10495 [Akkermansiaceae bacterium]